MTDQIQIEAVEAERAIASTLAAADSVEPYQRFADIASDDIDLIDNVAYALYKRRKLEFVRAFVAAKGKSPNPAEVNNFILAATLPTSVDSLRAEATETLRTFSEQVLREAEAETEDRYRRQLMSELKKARPFLKTLMENILANIGALAVTALILLVIYGSRIGAVNLFGEVFGYEIKDKTSGAQPVAPSSQVRP